MSISLRTVSTAVYQYSKDSLRQRLVILPIKRVFTTDTPKASEAPLKGIRVLDLTRVLAGPYCTMMLGDLGAEVIKIEHPRGDDTRAWGPPFTESMDPQDDACQGESAYFLSVNRNKKSVTINFKSKEGQTILHDLVKQCDVLVENYVPGKLAEIGMGYDQVSKINPRLIYASITGYGQTGPYASRPGYDVVIEAEAGLMHITGEPNGPPVKVGVAITGKLSFSFSFFCKKTSLYLHPKPPTRQLNNPPNPNPNSSFSLTQGLHAHSAILAALFQRHTTDRGQWIDCSLLESQVSTLVNIGSNYLIGQKEAQRMGTSHPSIVPYQVFPTKDSFIMLGAGNDGQFSKLCHYLGLSSLVTDLRFITNALRVQHRQALVGVLQERLQQATTQHWLDQLKQAGCPMAPINNIKGTMEHPQIQARGLVQEVEHAKAGKIRLIGPPVKYSGFTPAIRLPPPVLGAHTEHVLQEVLGYSKADIERLNKNKALG
ncbi:CoA-transferase family III domain-containing protein [Spinellus fusiger]|nr:CoA-transferase family III domain-containing protein [Spinellus fusiger]